MVLANFKSVDIIDGSAAMFHRGGHTVHRLRLGVVGHVLVELYLGGVHQRHDRVAAEPGP